MLSCEKKKIKVKTWHHIFDTNFTKKFSRKVLTNAAPIWYNKRLGGWGGTPKRNFLRILPLFYYITKKFLFQDLTKQNPENFQKKFLLIRLTSTGVSWYNKRGRKNLFFFFFLRRAGSQLQLLVNTNKCSRSRSEQMFDEQMFVNQKSWQTNDRSLSSA